MFHLTSLQLEVERVNKVFIACETKEITSISLQKDKVSQNEVNGLFYVKLKDYVKLS